MQERKERAQTLDLLERRQMLAAHISGSSVIYANIQSAVDAAPPGATVTVDAGSYAGQVVVAKPLTIKGARAGVDGRSNLRGVAESLVTGDNSGGIVTSSFRITASDVTIDGFEIAGETSTDDTRGAAI